MSQSTLTITESVTVSLQGGFDDVMPEDSDGRAAGSPRAASPSPGPGPGPGPQGNMHVILHVTLM